MTDEHTTLPSPGDDLKPALHEVTEVKAVNTKAGRVVVTIGNSQSEITPEAALRLGADLVSAARRCIRW